MIENAIKISENEIKDRLGRIFKLKEITGKTRIAFYRALGAKDAANMGVITEYWPVMAVDSIDGNPCYIKSLVDIDYIYNEMERGECFALIDEWLVTRDQQRTSLNKEEKDLKKQ